MQRGINVRVHTTRYDSTDQCSAICPMRRGCNNAVVGNPCVCYTGVEYETTVNLCGIMAVKFPCQERRDSLHHNILHTVFVPVHPDGTNMQYMADGRHYS